MTRINSAINPSNLTDQHLLAELRELPRIFTSVRKRLEDNRPFDDIPSEFTLGTGHMKFFYNKLFFLHTRFSHLRLEYYLRFSKEWPYHVYCPVNLNHELYRDYFPTSEERNLLIERISARIFASTQHPRYYSEEISKQEAIEILKLSR